jgi:hypothetical protein
MCVVKGQGQALDAKGGGRFFYANGAGSSLEVHGLVLKNGNGGAIYVSTADVRIYDTEFIWGDASRACGRVLVPRIFLSSPICPAGHPTQ